MIFLTLNKHEHQRYQILGYIRKHSSRKPFKVKELELEKLERKQTRSSEGGQVVTSHKAILCPVIHSSRFSRRLSPLWCMTATALQLVSRDKQTFKARTWTIWDIPDECTTFNNSIKSTPLNPLLNELIFNNTPVSCIRLSLFILKIRLEIKLHSQSVSFIFSIQLYSLQMFD